MKNIVKRSVLVVLGLLTTQLSAWNLNPWKKPTLTPTERMINLGKGLTQAFEDFEFRDRYNTCKLQIEKFMADLLQAKRAYNGELDQNYWNEQYKGLVNVMADLTKRCIPSESSYDIIYSNVFLETLERWQKDGTSTQKNIANEIAAQLAS